MNNSECEDTYRQLVNMMADRHMKWVVQEVEERIATDGTQPVDEVISEDTEQLTLFDEQKASVAEKVSTAQSRLIMLIDEIHHTVVHPAECRHFLFRYLRGKDIREVLFLSPDGDGKRLVLEKASIQEQFYAARKLGHVLQSLRYAVTQEV